MLFQYVLFFFFHREHLDLGERLLQVLLGGACLIRQAPYLLHFFSAANYSSYVPNIHSLRLIKSWRKDSYADAPNPSHTVNGHLFSTFLPSVSRSRHLLQICQWVSFLLHHTKWVPQYILRCAWNHKQSMHIGVNLKPQISFMLFLSLYCPHVHCVTTDLLLIRNQFYDIYDDLMSIFIF